MNKLTAYINLLMETPATFNPAYAAELNPSNIDYNVRQHLANVEYRVAREYATPTERATWQKLIVINAVK